VVAQVEQCPGPGVWRGEDARQVRKVKFKLHDKQSALDMLARHLSMYPMSERRSRRPKFAAR
jgi:hypothetical protein